MKQRTFFILTMIVIGGLLTGCSSKTEDELVTVQNDMKENVGDTLLEIEEEFDQKAAEVDNGTLTPEEFTSYYNKDIQPSIDEARQYIQGYDKPTTEDGKEYFIELTDGLNLGLDMLEKFSELMTALTDELVTEEALHELGLEIDNILEEIEQQEQKVQSLKDKYEGEYNVEFEDNNLG